METLEIQDYVMTAQSRAMNVWAFALTTLLLLTALYFNGKKIESPALSEHIRRIVTSYAMWFNNKYGRYDHLFQDRFKSEIIETENYLLQCFHYILQGIYTINKTPKTYIPTHMLNIYIKQYYRTTN